MIRDYYELTKPGVVYGNALPAIGAFILASGGVGQWEALIATVVGLSLVIASGLVCNNLIDRDIDSVMARTTARALVRGSVTARAALLYALALGGLGFALLLRESILAALFAALGFFLYVVVYSLWAKRGTMYGTHIGALSGAVPPVVGYVAVAGQLDLTALVLFLVLFFWQMPHFFGIVIRRSGDYQAAQIPALPLVRSAQETRVQIVFYIVAFAFAALALPYVRVIPTSYTFIMAVVSLSWLAVACWGMHEENQRAWASRVFFASLYVLVGFSAALALTPFLP